MSLQPGDRLGVFEILGPLGTGGMGEVYRARDTRLDRDVAIKVLPPAFSSDPLRVTRFQREARMLAAINHPAIAAIYGAEESDGVPFIVMELVPGDTLAEWTARGPLSLEESLSFARQIAEALEAAHERGVVHRDLKPSNIKITPGGRVKVLDLGLAKMREEEQPPSLDPSHSPTMVVQDQTRPGVILGTVEFMSPEQARGKQVDKRTDIWSFGCVLFEMLSGRRAFTGETVSDILVSILTKQPDWGALPAYTPDRLRELLSRCLEKDANQRLRDIGEARVELERTLPGSGEKHAAPLLPLPARRRWWHAPALVALLIFAGVTVWLVLRSAGDSSRAAPLENSLVVLPANVMGGAPDSKLVGDGLVEMLSVRLNQVPGIQVVTPAAAVQASDKSPDPFGAARSVGANLLVRSSVVRSGDRLRIIYSVWNVQSRAQVVGGTVDGSASDLFGMQDQLAERVAAQLKLPKPSKKTSSPTGLETASQQERYVLALGNLQRYDKPASVDEAIRLLETLASERPQAAVVQAALGRADLYKFNLTREPRWAERADEAVTRARKLAPELPEVDATLGALLIRTGKPHEALAAFRRVLSLQPNDFEALLGLAQAYDAAGDGANAEANYRRAIQLQPSYWTGYSKLASYYYSHGRYPAAAEMMRRVTELTPDNARAFSNLGGISLRMGDFDGAISAYRKSLQIQPNELAYSNLGTAQFYLGRFKESAESFEFAARLAPNHFQVWANLGDAYRWSPGIEAKAVECYARAIELGQGELRLNPRNALVHSVLAGCLAKTGKSPDAEEHVQKALGLEPHNSEYLYKSALVALLAGQKQRALDQLRQAAEAGYNRLLIARDPELTNLRNERAYQETVRPQQGS